MAMDRILETTQFDNRVQSSSPAVSKESIISKLLPNSTLSFSREFRMHESFNPMQIVAIYNETEK